MRLNNKPLLILPALVLSSASCANSNVKSIFVEIFEKGSTHNIISNTSDNIWLKQFSAYESNIYIKKSLFSSGYYEKEIRQSLTLNTEGIDVYRFSVDSLVKKDNEEYLKLLLHFTTAIPGHIVFDLNYKDNFFSLTNSYVRDQYSPKKKDNPITSTFIEFLESFSKYSNQASRPITFNEISNPFAEDGVIYSITDSLFINYNSNLYDDKILEYTNSVFYYPKSINNKDVLVSFYFNKDKYLFDEKRLISGYSLQTNDENGNKFICILEKTNGETDVYKSILRSLYLFNRDSCDVYHVDNINKDAYILNYEIPDFNNYFPLPVEFYNPQETYSHHYRITLSLSEFLKASKSIHTSFMPLFISLMAKAVNNNYDIANQNILMALPVDLRAVFKASSIVNFSDAVFIPASKKDMEMQHEDLCSHIKNIINLQRKPENYAKSLYNKSHAVTEFERENIITKSKELTSSVPGGVTYGTSYLGIMDMPGAINDLFENIFVDAPFAVSYFIITTFRDTMNVTSIQRFDDDKLVKALNSELINMGFKTEFTDRGRISHNIIDLEKLRKVN